jgi:hypothetical protein
MLVVLLALRAAVRSRDMRVCEARGRGNVYHPVPTVSTVVSRHMYAVKGRTLL